MRSNIQIKSIKKYMKNRRDSSPNTEKNLNSKNNSKSPKKKQNKNPFQQKNQNRKKKFRPGQLALKQIKKYQACTTLIIQKAPFQRFVRDVTQQQTGSQFRWTSNALLVIQAASQDYMTGIFQDSYLCSMHCKRSTLMSKDLMLARRIRGLTDVANK